ncbi:MAG TPA: hypothetical protein PLU30_18845 [Verrucomicrobiae bacterium]|nr:hypothetical protein [Verrucomicrobiae bacterium]
MSPLRFLHRGWAAIIDLVTFELVNLIQHRHAAAAITPEKLGTYLAEWEGVSAEEFYAAQDLALDLCPGAPPSGRVTCPSPVSLGEANNDRVVFEFFPAGPSWDRPVMFLLHGLMSASAVGYRAWARKVNGEGWHAVFVHLPFHYDRCPSGYISGELAVSPDGARTVGGVRQAVVEIRSLMRRFRAMGAPYAGCWGMSYGGWIGALLAVFEPLVRCAMLMEPIVDFQHATWESPATRTLRQHVERGGVTREMVAALDRLVSPMTMRPVCDPGHIALLAAQFDRIATPEIIRELARAWGCHRYRCYPQGHVGYRLMREAFREWRDELRPMLEGKGQGSL